VSITASSILSSWISFNDKKYSSISAGSSILIKVTLSVTFNICSGNYTGEIKVSSSNAGTLTIPVEVTFFTISLVGTKFNLASFPFSVNSSQTPNFVKAYSFDWSNYWTTPTTFEPGEGYWIKVTQDEDVTLTGTPVSSPVSVTVTPGKFNLLGNPFNTPISLSDLNTANGNHILKVYTFDWSHYWTAWTPTSRQDFTTLEPGRAYWIQLDSSASNTLTFSLP